MHTLNTCRHVLCCALLRFPVLGVAPNFGTVYVCVSVYAYAHVYVYVYMSVSVCLTVRMRVYLQCRHDMTLVREKEIAVTCVLVCAEQLAIQSIRDVTVNCLLCPLPPKVMHMRGSRAHAPSPT